METPRSKVSIWDRGVLFLKTMRRFKNSNRYKLTGLLCIGFCLSMACLFSQSSASEVAVIRVKYRWASEVLPIVQSMLSPEGTVTVSKRINSLVVVDSSDAIRRVRAYLDEFDKPLEQVRIHVRFDETMAVSEKTVSARGTASGNNVRVSVGRKKEQGSDISLENRQLYRKRHSEFFVFATSGQSAFIRAATEIPYIGRWPDYTRRYSGQWGSIRFQNVETGFDVTPTVAGDLVHLKIVPRIAYSEGEEAVIRFFGAQTEVTTSFGRWVEIGGTDSRSNDVIREILSGGIADKRNSMTMSLMVAKP